MFLYTLTQTQKGRIWVSIVKINITVVLYLLIIMLLFHTLNAMHHVLNICDQFAVDFDVKFNSSK